jgi:hypothetical protein
MLQDSLRHAALDSGVTWPLKSHTNHIPYLHLSTAPVCPSPPCAPRVCGVLRATWAILVQATWRDGIEDGRLAALPRQPFAQHVGPQQVAHRS